MHAAPISLHSQGVAQLLQGLSWDSHALTHVGAHAHSHTRTHTY